jgi:glycosyltransferase involved in cell wall biosynthesis
MDSNSSGYNVVDKKEDTTYNPLVSIITMALNSIKFFEPCIESVLSQGYTHIEHVFIDGGSTDGTLDVLSNYSAKYPGRVRFISEPDSGRDDAANKGVQMARGEIIAIVGSDDMLEPGAIQIIVEFFRANPGAYFVYGDCNFVDAKGRVIMRYRPGDFSLKKILNDKMYIATTSAFYKREVFERVGAFYINPEAALISDFDFVIRASKTFQIYRVDEVLSSFRARKIILSGKSWQTNKKMMRAFYIVSRRYGGRILSWHFGRYFACLLIDWMRPVLSPIYPFLEKVLARIYKRQEANV